MEVKKHSLSECTFTQTQVSVSCCSASKTNENVAWSWVDVGESAVAAAAAAAAVAAVGSTDTTQPLLYEVATRLAVGTTLQIRPFRRDSNNKDWDDRYFHRFCKLPHLDNNRLGDAGLVVTLESRARECIAVALSPQPDFVMGKTYVVHFGASGNTCTVIRRRMTSNSDATCVTFPTPHICCSDQKFLSYWIILTKDGYLTVGLGKVPGQFSIGTMDDSFYYTQLRTGLDAVQYVGVGNSAIGRHAQDYLEVRNLRLMYIPRVFQTLQLHSNDTNNNYFTTTGGIPCTEWMNSITQQSNQPVLHPDYCLDTASSSESKDMDFVLQGDELSLWADYQKECMKAKARATKFGVEYKMPSPEVFFKYSQAKRMKANPQKGFVTGLDITTPEEQEKAFKRMQRFQSTTTDTLSSSLSDHLKRKQEDEEVAAVEEVSNEKTANVQIENENDGNIILPVEQAWDNLNMVKGMRIDLPAYLYPNEFDKDIVLENEEEEEGKIIPEKLHLFAIDWAAFKQIRTDDILAHFSDYGPSYVEWLGELSCNIHFEDKYSASRAILAMSQVLPAPPPSLISSISQEQNFQGVMSDSVHLDGEESPPLELLDLGRMGWRFCKYPIRKTIHDRYGRVGTRARFLIRLASNLDVLDEKPKQKPIPPPGFTTTRILGPGSDFPKQRRRVESLDDDDGTRRNPSKRPRIMHVIDVDKDEPLGLSRSLKAPRASI